ncbi:Cytochrome P450 [Mycena venus]|uniref:Cytochrome P450 n=1 Tax=Mycena venus TaxID=2733690 RepID=A0A8H7CF49_9AGAR|nr:Cytochrome P450 [Mycena venus]
MIVFMFAMLLHPECQLKAQKEIDSVVGSSRLPSFEDRGKLPYLDHIGLKDYFWRWKPVLPLGIPHRSTEKDVYRGMHIPKGSIVVPNVRGMSLDESVYHNPKSFYPERFLPQPLGHGEPHFASSAFGYGRRICPGLHLAENSLWIAIATILATCNITNTLDEHGNIIVPECVMSEGADCHPIDFEYIVRSRSSAAEAQLNEDTDLN